MVATLNDKLHRMTTQNVRKNFPHALHFNPIETHFFAQSQASGTALFWAIHM